MTVATQTITVIDPATEQEVADYEAHDEEQVDAILAEAARAFARWRLEPAAVRGALLRRAADQLRREREAYAELITQEVGKPLAEARAEVEKCAWGCTYYAEEGERLLADEPVAIDAATSFVAYEPLGVILAVMPWNYPFWQALRFAAPALMAGNAGVLKHAPNASGCALAIEELFRRAGAPDGLFRSLLVSEAAVPERTAALIDDPRIAAVTLTGSERAGAAVAAAAGRALKKTVLELGGSDPFIVLADADLPVVAQQAARARFQNAGQSCIAAKRFLVHGAVADEFEQRFTDAVASLVVGDPRDPATQIGPLARLDLLEAVDRQVHTSVEQGARLLLGGHRLDRPGYFYAPTILTGVDSRMPVFREETFGPVAAITTFDDDRSAVELANQTPYGLGASLWTRDVDHARELGRDIQSGALFVNGIVASDPRLPFGGTKRSGYGRELAAAGLREFTNVRTYWLAAAGAE